MSKSIKIWGKKLEISKKGAYYMVCNSKADLFIHANKLKLGHYNDKKDWLSMLNNDNTYIGSIWINTDTDMKNVKKFLEETK